MKSVNYWAMRTDRKYRLAIMDELIAGRLRQGWGYSAEQDLGEIEKRWNWHGGAWANLTDDQKDAAGHFAFLGRDEPGMMQAGDVVLVPKLPTDDSFVLCELLEGGYEFSIHNATRDHGHIRPVKLLTPNGVFKNAEAVEAPIRKTLRTRSRLWSLRHYEAEMERLLANLNDPKLIGTKIGAEERVARLQQTTLDVAVAAAEVVEVDRWFESVGWEHLLTHVVGDLFRVRVEHTGGRTEQGADVVVRISQPFSPEDLLVVVQVKNHDPGSDTGTQGITQLREAIRSRRGQGSVAMAVLATTGSASKEAKRAAEELERDEGVRVTICAGQKLQRLVRRGLLLSALQDPAMGAGTEP